MWTAARWRKPCLSAGTHKLKSALPIFSLVFLVGCATTPPIADSLNRWVGQDVNGLIRRLGPPDRIYKMPNGNSLYSYTRGHTETMPVVKTPTYILPPRTTVSISGGETHVTTTGGEIFGGEVYGGGKYRSWCNLHLEVNRADRIVGWSAQGNACDELLPASAPPL